MINNWNNIFSLSLSLSTPADNQKTIENYVTNAWDTPLFDTSLLDSVFHFFYKNEKCKRIIDEMVVGVYLYLNVPVFARMPEPCAPVKK